MSDAWTDCRMLGLKLDASMTPACPSLEARAQVWRHVPKSGGTCPKSGGTSPKSGGTSPKSGGTSPWAPWGPLGPLGPPGAPRTPWAPQGPPGARPARAGTSRLERGLVGSTRDRIFGRAPEFWTCTRKKGGKKIKSPGKTPGRVWRDPRRNSVSGGGLGSENEV